MTVAIGVARLLGKFDGAADSDKTQPASKNANVLLLPNLRNCM